MARPVREDRADFREKFTKKNINMNKYQVTGYQVINNDGSRDSIKLVQPEIVTDIELYRASIMARHGCRIVNLSYITLFNKED